MSIFKINSNSFFDRAKVNVSRTDQGLRQAIMRLSSGKRINSAADDAAGLAVSAKLRAQVRSLAQAQRNGNDGVSLLQTAESGLEEISEMLTRVRELALEASSGTLSSSDRLEIDDEYDELRSEIDRIAGAAEFNGLDLLDGDLSTGIEIQVGANGTSGDRISVSISDAQATALGLTAAMTLSTVTGAQTSLSLIDAAIDAASSRRGSVGALQNRISSALNFLEVQQETLTTAESRIVDADIATETANLSRNQILAQAGMAVLAQASGIPSYALDLLS